MPILNDILEEAGVDSNDLRLIDGGDPIDYALATVQLIEMMIDKGTDPGGRLQKSARRHMVWETEAAKIAQLYHRLLKKSCAI